MDSAINSNENTSFFGGIAARYGLLITLTFSLAAIPSCRSFKDNASLPPGRNSFNTVDQLMVLKIFPFFSLLNDYPAAAGSFLSDREVISLSEVIDSRYRDAVKTCDNGACLAEKLAFSNKEIESLKKIISRPQTALSIKPSQLKNYPYFITTTGSEHLSGLLEESLLATNHILNTYLAGKPPRYAAIDAGDFKPDDEDFVRRIKTGIVAHLLENDKNSAFFMLPLKTSLLVLNVNGRNEAVRYEPLTGQINKGVSDRAGKINWNKYHYAALLVPGLGPATVNRPLDPGGARRCDMAAQRFKMGEAPFIIVSGGHVHPSKTPYSEAVEMKKYLIEQHNIPADAIIAEPHARHTTTNLRNAARLIHIFKIPAGKPVMVVSDPIQSAYVFMLAGRFQAELGYLPYKSLQKSISGAPVFYADSSCFRRNPFDPLDP